MCDNLFDVNHVMQFLILKLIHFIKMLKERIEN